MLAKKNFIFIFLSIVCMTAIFILSAQNADKSSSTSGFFVNFFLNHFVSDFKSFSLEKQEYIHGLVSFTIRKCAHFSAYALTGFCVSGSFPKFRLKSLNFPKALAICFVYACTDEFHQHFVPGRSCEFRDVMIDTAGALTGILIFTAILYFIHRKSRSSVN